MNEQMIYTGLWILDAALVVFCIIDLLKNPRFEGALRWMAMAAIIVFPIVGPLLYLLMRNAEIKPRHFGGE